MNDDVTLTIDERQYIDPTVSRDEQLAFIDTLRGTQAQNTAQINQAFSNLGSQVPSNIGGLTGSEGLWEAQYQLPQTQAQVANLRATAQQTALNQAMQNLSDVYKNRYKQALRAYYARNKGGNGNPSGGGGNDGDVTFTPSDTIAAELQEIGRDSFFGQAIRGNQDLPGYYPGISAITGDSEAERRAKFLAERIKAAQERAQNGK